MSKKIRSILLKYGISFALCALAAVGIYTGRLPETPAQRDIWRVLSDACFVPGVLMLFAGLAVWLSNEGTLNAVTWLTTYAFQSLFPGLRGKRERYGDYVLRQQEKKVKGYGFLFVVGLIFVAAGIVCYFLYKKYY